MRILITGASGFVGRALVGHLLKSRPGDHLCLAIRNLGDYVPHSRIQSVVVGDINQFTDWSDLYRDSNEVLEAVEVRLASKNPRFDSFENL